MAASNDCGKKTVQVNVKMTEADARQFGEASARIWPHAILSKSALVLGLAKMAAKEILHR